MSSRYEGVKRVEQTWGEDNVNRFLALGWKILDVQAAPGGFTKFAVGWGD
jgi:hypothetical protein